MCVCVLPGFFSLVQRFGVSSPPRSDEQAGTILSFLRFCAQAIQATIQRHEQTVESFRQLTCSLRDEESTPPHSPVRQPGLAVRVPQTRRPAVSGRLW